MRFFKRKNKNKDNLKKVMAFGTFDIFHPGHDYYLKKAKELGDYLIVVVARDKTVQKVKGALPEQEEKRRVDGVSKYVTADEIVLGSLSDKYAVLKKYMPSVLAFGYDQEISEEELLGKLEEFELECKVKRIRSFKPEVYKSSKFRNNK